MFAILETCSALVNAAHGILVTNIAQYNFSSQGESMCNVYLMYTYLHVQINE